MKRRDALRITGVDEGPPPHRHAYFIYCMAVHKHNAVFSCFWDGYHREYNVGSPTEVRWIQSCFRLSFKELRIETGFLGLRRWVIVEIGWLPPLDKPFQPSSLLEI